MTARCMLYIFFIFVLLSIISASQDVSMHVASRANSIAILGLRGGFARIANMLNLVHSLFVSQFKEFFEFLLVFYLILAI